MISEFISVVFRVSRSLRLVTDIFYHPVGPWWPKNNMHCRFDCGDIERQSYQELLLIASVQPQYYS